METPLSVGLGLVVHQRTRSKELIDTLNSMNLSITYDKVLDIKRSIAAAVKDKAANMGGIYLPSVLSPETPVCFAIDNCDIKIDTPDGKGQLHGTAITVFQQRNTNGSSELSIDRSKKHQKDKEPLYPIQYCTEPPRINTSSSPDFFQNLMKEEETGLYRLRDRAYFLLKSLNITSRSDLPTWAAFNSLVEVEQPVTTFCSLPLIQGSPTDWSNLYSALLAAEKIRVSTSSSGKTVITLDLQLYSKCVQQQAREEISSKFVFRMGELHVVFAALKCIGKFIDNSGLDAVFIEAGIYC